MGIKLTIINTEAAPEKDSITNSDNETTDAGNEAKSENIIKLTDHTIMNYNKRFDDMGTNDEYLSGEISGIELTGKVNIYDKSGEILDMKNLSSWAKISSHEKETYREIMVEISDSSNTVYDSLHFKKAFIVNYKELYKGTKGMGEFYVFIRWLDTLDKLIKE